MVLRSKTKTREISIVEDKGAFNALFGRGDEEEFDFQSLGMLRKILSNERARIMRTIKTKQPRSLYMLAKTVGRDFKSVKSDIDLLERFGFVEMIAEKTGKRERLRPILTATNININLTI